MKKYLVCSLLVAAVALTSSAFAEDAAAKPEKPAKAAKAEKAEKGEKAKSNTRQMTGVITAVDVAANTVTIKPVRKGDDVTTFKAEGAKVMTAEKKDATLADLKVDTKVMVLYTEENDVKIAKKIGLPLPPKAKEPKAEKAPKAE